MAQDEDNRFVEEAWNKEILRRIEELDSGKAKTIPWDEVQKEIAAKLKRGPIKKDS